VTIYTFATEIKMLDYGVLFHTSYYIINAPDHLFKIQKILNSETYPAQAFQNYENRRDSYSFTATVPFQALEPELSFLFSHQLGMLQNGQKNY